MNNKISIIAKVVENNIPGFDESKLGSNKWYKKYDFKCVDWAYGNTVQNYDLEYDINYKGSANKHSATFFVESSAQEVVPPYDMHEGDYVAYVQGGHEYKWRIVKINQSQVFDNCCVYELIGVATQPKEENTVLSCGLLQIYDCPKLEQP